MFPLRFGAFYYVPGLNTVFFHDFILTTFSCASSLLLVDTANLEGVMMVWRFSRRWLAKTLRRLYSRCVYKLAAEHCMNHTSNLVEICRMYHQRTLLLRCSHTYSIPLRSDHLLMNPFLTYSSVFLNCLWCHEETIKTLRARLDRHREHILLIRLPFVFHRSKLTS